MWRGPLFIRSAAALTATPQDRVMVLRLPKTPPLDLEAALSAEWRAGDL
jgi:aminoglycoside 2'-N-acetyltransferase I